MTLPGVADSLADRMGIVRLLPLAQAELQGAPTSFLDEAFAGRPLKSRAPIVGDDLVETVLAGGYPEALTRSGGRRRRDWHLDYIEAIVQRDVRDVVRIGQLGLMPRLLRVLAEHSGQLVNSSAFGASLGMNHVTMRKYMGVLENLFLVHVLPPWCTNALKRVTRSPRLQILDSGLLAALRGITPDRLHRDRTPFGTLLETFVLAELLKLASWADDRYIFSHFRDKERNEVDSASGWCSTTMKERYRLASGWRPPPSRRCGPDAKPLDINFFKGASPEIGEWIHDRTGFVFPAGKQVFDIEQNPGSQISCQGKIGFKRPVPSSYALLRIKLDCTADERVVLPPVRADFPSIQRYSGRWHRTRGLRIQPDKGLSFHCGSPGFKARLSRVAE